MTVICEASFARSLADWEAEFSAPEYRGVVVEAWLFEDEKARRNAEARLALLGVSARFRSAYKPLVHFFLEEVDLHRLVAARVRYPVHPAAPANRFTLEAYPLAALLGDAALAFEPGDESLHYQVELHYAEGRTSRHLIFAPNRVTTDAAGQACLSPTGWLRVRQADDVLAPPVRDEARLTDFERLFMAAMDAVRAHAWGDQEPYFERLVVRVDIAGIERPLPVGDEVISTFEALHEDFYFSLLEFFQQHSGKAIGDRSLQPGQIVPDIRRAETGVSQLYLSTEQFADGPGGDRCAEPIEEVSPHRISITEAPLSPGCIAEALAALGGQSFLARSREGREVRGIYRAGSGPAVLISAGQHANETSGVVGALRAAGSLLEKGAAEPHFALIALENPDGYALHRALRAIHPRHMHHAARYSALGDDIAYRSKAPLLEREARERAVRVSGAELHLNLHGYPSHEWTRPLSGYLPRGFELWTLPKGFFLVMRYHPGWEAMARGLLSGVTERLARVPGLLEFNARQLNLFRAHALADGFDTMNGIPVQITESDRETTPLSLITEFPDETIYGAAFRFAHDVQAAAVVAAVGVYRALRSSP